MTIAVSPSTAGQHKPYVDSEGVGHLPLVLRGHLQGWVQVDSDLLDDLANHRWHLHATGYAARGVRSKTDGAFRLVYLHRAVLGVEGAVGMQVRFRSGDRFDCRRANLLFSLRALSLKLAEDSKVAVAVCRAVTESVLAAVGTNGAAA